MVKYLSKFIYGRISLATVKFSPWLAEGRCAELSLNLIKIFGKGLNMLNVVNATYSSFDPD